MNNGRLKAAILCGKRCTQSKKTSSKALVMAHAYSNVIIDKIEEAVKNGLVGNESDNW